ncbi:MAG: type VI secretion system lipoprotein TssJ [Betaproteobacteria bacterium]|nr:type VI secretion system lipoprotein TssJ [Betaproteobacteria bacterium]
MAFPRIAVLRALLVCSCVVAACASAPKAPAISATLSAAADVNPDVNGRASPIMVRVYELKTPATFEGSDFFSLFDKDRQILAADLLARDEFVMRPGETRTIERSGNPDTRYLAVLVGYRDIEHSIWRAHVPLVAGDKNVLKIQVGARAVRISAGK